MFKAVGLAQDRALVSVKGQGAPRINMVVFPKELVSGERALAHKSKGAIAHKMRGNK